VNRFTMQKTEYNLGRRSHYRKEYNDRIGFIASAIDTSASDCFVCKDRNIFMTGIRGQYGGHFGTTRPPEEAGGSGPREASGNRDTDIIVRQGLRRKDDQGKELRRNLFNE